jgi:hypothetical protein
LYFCEIPCLFQGVALSRAFNLRKCGHVSPIESQKPREIYFEQGLWIVYIFY